VNRDGHPEKVVQVVHPLVHPPGTPDPRKESAGPDPCHNPAESLRLLERETRFELATSTLASSTLTSKSLGNG